MNDLSYTVVGVLPRDFELVSKASDFQARNQFDVRVPLALNLETLPRNTRTCIRLAVGATQGDVLRLVLGRAGILIVAGLCLGLLGSVVLTRLIVSLLYGVTPFDLVTFAAVSLLLSAVALVASYIPARRATRIDPLVALRCE